MRFMEAFPEWFEISNENQNEIERFSKEFKEIKNNTYSKIPDKKSSHSRFGETVFF